jgi:hypothetical protein
MVELMGGRRGAAPRDSVGLLDEGYAEALGDGRLGDGDEVASVHAATRAVAEYDRAERLVDQVQVCAGRSVSSFDHEQGPLIVASSAIRWAVGVLAWR